MQCGNDQPDATPDLRQPDHRGQHASARAGTGNDHRKKQYGYLKKPLKQLVDTVVDALTELPEVSECYEVWNQIHEELNECYGHSTPWERLPLSQRKEFRKIKNDIIREAENIRLGLSTFEDERMQDEPEPESQKEEHQSYSVYEQAQRYRAAKGVLQDIYALDAEHVEAVKALERLWEEGYTVAAHQLGKFYRDDFSTLRDHEKQSSGFATLQKPVMISRSTPSESCSSLRSVQ